MAIEYHEGLPGAGKSYEAVVFHIIPALKSRRSVVTNIRGMNYERLSELTGEPLEMIKLLLINVEPAEQDSADGEVQRCINEMCDKTPDNSLVVWDEIQDYFPSGNAKLPLNQQKFWTEHRHRGLDIIIMGQDRSDVHKIIRNRIRTVIYFLKLEAIGRDGHYKWEIYQKQRFGKFVKTGSGTRSYDEKFFGTYMSHRREGTRATVYTTTRTNMLANSRGLTLGVPLAFVAAGYAVYYLWGFFHPAPKHDVSAQRVEVAAQEPASLALVNPPPDDMPELASGASTVVTTSAAVEQKPPPVDYFDKLAQRLQVRASAIMESTKPGKELLGYVELLDDSFHQKEKFSIAELRAMDWVVTRTGYGLLLEKQGVAYVARPWPIDIYGRVDQRTVDSLGGSSASAQTAQGSKPSEVRVTVVPDSSRSPRTL
ncbi:zonular occludens toxin domain-containing protein [Pseudomonas aeruginosa]